MTARLIPLALLLLAATPSQAVTVSVDAIPGLPGIENSVDVTSGSSFEIDVLIQDVTDLAGFQFDLTFDPAILAATAITSGDIFGMDGFLITSTIGAGTLSFAEVSVGLGLDIGATPDPLATIAFDALAAGTSALTLGNLVLSDSFAMDITPVIVVDGQAMVTAAPLPGTLALLLAGLVGIRGYWGEKGGKGVKGNGTDLSPTD